VVAVVADLLARPQSTHHLDRFLQHLQTLVRGGPAIAQHVLVQVLAGADTQLELAVQHDRRGGGSLGDDRRVDAHGGTRDRGGHGQRRGGGDGTDDAPHERAVALLVEPRVEVVGDPDRSDAGVGRQLRLLHEIERVVFF
jgi:hypothetical protein